MITILSQKKMQSIRNRPLYIVANRWLATKNVGLFEMTYRLSLVGLRLFRPKAGWPVVGL